jgi:hypothetical protein
MVVILRGALEPGSSVKRESGGNPELPRSGKQERKLTWALILSRIGKPSQ